MQPQILNVIGTRPKAGIKTVLDNYESSFKNNIIYDFMIFSEESTGLFDIQMRNHGREVYLFKSFRIKNIVKLYNDLNDFFKINKDKYNIIHIHTPNVAFIVSPIAKKYGVKIIIGHSHATKYSDKWSSKVRNFILLINRNAYFTHIGACSTEALKFLSRFTINKSKIIIKNAIKIEKFKFDYNHREQVRREYNIENNQILVGCIGRFNNQKNQEFLLSVFKDLKKYSKFHLILIGSGPNKRKLEEYILQHDMHNVTILDFQNNIHEIYNGLDVLALPSRYEGLPMVAVEALANGLPILLSDKITKDLSCISTTYLSIDDKKNWYQAILNTNPISNMKRRENRILEELGYDIKVEQRKLLEYYEEIINEK